MSGDFLWLELVCTLLSLVRSELRLQVKEYS